MVVREDPDSSWNVIGALQEDDLVVDDPVAERSQEEESLETDIPTPSVEVSDSDTPTRSLSGGSSSFSNTDAFQTKKRTLPTPPSIDGPSVKRSRTSGPSQKLCQAPPPNSFAQAIFVQDGARTRGEGDIFLSGDWRERWCLCDLCLPRLEEHPYLLKEDETYEPPEDPDSGKLQSVVDVGRTDNDFVGLSLEELGLRALERIPRDRALDGIRAFNSMRCVRGNIFQNIWV